jgi:hypothetical protein
LLRQHLTQSGKHTVSQYALSCMSYGFFVTLGMAFTFQNFQNEAVSRAQLFSDTRTHAHTRWQARTSHACTHVRARTHTHHTPQLFTKRKTHVYLDSPLISLFQCMELKLSFPIFECYDHTHNLSMI